MKFKQSKQRLRRARERARKLWQEREPTEIILCVLIFLIFVIVPTTLVLLDPKSNPPKTGETRDITTVLKSLSAAWMNLPANKIPSINIGVENKIYRDLTFDRMLAQVEASGLPVILENNTSLYFDKPRSNNSSNLNNLKMTRMPGTNGLSRYFDCYSRFKPSELSMHRQVTIPPDELVEVCFCTSSHYECRCCKTEAKFAASDEAVTIGVVIFIIIVIVASSLLAR